MSNQNTIFTRINQDEFDLLKKVSNARGESISTFVRRSVKSELGRLSFLPDEDKKALGILAIEGVRTNGN
jgi:hypothetical protein